MYGSTETAPLVTVGRHQEQQIGSEVAASAGIPVVGVDVDILDPDGCPVDVRHNRRRLLSRDRI